MESYQELKDKKILVLGFSKTGIAAAKYLANLGANVFLSESGENKDALKNEELNNLGIKTEFQGHSEEFITDAEFCILSPSIPTDAEILTRLKEKNIIDCDICSVCNSDKVRSYRVEGKDFKLATSIICM